MFNGLIKSIGQSVIQDLVTASAVYLGAHGVITNNQTQDYEGAAFFLAMLAFNAALQHIQTSSPATPAIKGPTP